MPDIVEIGPAWTLIAAPLLLFFAALAAGLDRVFARRAASSPFDEAARLMRQRRRTTVSADRPLWRIGVAGLVVVALLKIAILPLGQWTVADLSIGVVWFNAMDVIIWAVVWLAGWGANSHFSLIGAYRFLAQALSYELPLMFALTAPAVAASSLRLGDVVSAQQGLWFVVWMPVAFVVFCVSVIAFSVWGPF
ncbi:MAG: NADH-quinone oxidoreductase subunit H, partial [Rhodococcus sp. (in: high G+C Gram-positive bacteria)]